MSTKPSQSHRLETLRTYEFPAGLFDRVGAAHPVPGEWDADLVERGLRQWFEVSVRAAGARVAMPSRAVDDAWHEFITCTRAYADFCQRVLGRFLHHEPESSMAATDLAYNRTVATARAWALACAAEGSRWERPPLLFSVDGMLGLPTPTYVTACSGSSSTCWVAPPAVCVAHGLLVHLGPWLPQQRGLRSRWAFRGTPRYSAIVMGAGIAGFQNEAGAGSAGSGAFTGGDFGSGAFTGGDFGGGAGCGGGGCGGGG